MSGVAKIAVDKSTYRGVKPNEIFTGCRTIFLLLAHSWVSPVRFDALVLPKKYVVFLDDVLKFMGDGW